MRNCLTSLVVLTFLAGSRASKFFPRSVAVEERSLQNIYQAALEESGTLRVAWGGDVKASGSGVKAAFENKFPGINLDVHLDLSKYLDGYIDSTYASSNGTDSGVDVVVLQSLHDFTRWKSEDRLMPYKVAQWNDVYSQFADPDGMYLGLYMFTFGTVVYNPDITPQSSLPRTYTDCLNPQWYNRLILTYPNDDDAILFLFDTIIQKYGFDYMRALQAQRPRWVRGTATPSILMSPGRNNNGSTPNSQSISFASSSSFADGVAAESPQDVYMTWPQTGAIFANTNVPETSKLFLGFLMDDVWQETVSENRFATRRKFDRKGVFDQPGLDPLAYGRFMADRQRVEALRFQIENVIGTAQGEDPVDEY